MIRWALTQTLAWWCAHRKWKIPLWDHLAKLGVWVAEHSPTIVLPALFIASLFVLLSPSILLSRMGIISLSAERSVIPGIVCIVSASLVVVYAGRYAILAIFAKKRLRDQLKHLGRLTNPEKVILQGYYKTASKSAYLDASDGVVAGLQRSGIIFRASELPASQYQPTIFAHNIEDWVWEAIRNHPSLLQ